MNLSNYFSPEAVLRDGSFETLCLSNSRPGAPALSFLDTARCADELNANPEIVCVICTLETAAILDDHIQGVVLSEAPREAYFTLHNHLSADPSYCPPLRKTKIGPNCQISPLSYIAPEGVLLGDGVVVAEFVSIHGPCIIGDHSVIHSGAKLGGAGFEFKCFTDQVLDVVHCGLLEIGEDVVIWENTTIHRAVYPWDRTYVGPHSRIGANSHIDHGVKLGAFCQICARALVSGRAEAGERTYVGPGSVISNRLHLGPGARTSLGSVVTKDVPAGQTVSGNFAIEHQKYLDFIKKIR